MASDKTTEKPQDSGKGETSGVSGGEFTKMLLGALIGTAVGVAGTLFVGWWTAKEPHLRYSVSDPIQFQGEKLKVGIVNVVITNDGTKKAEKVEMNMALNGAKIQEVKTSPEHLKTEITRTDEKCLVTLALLNHTETLQVSALYYNADQLKGPPMVSVRGDDVVGDNQPIKSSNPIIQIAAVALIVHPGFCKFPARLGGDSA